MDTQTQLLTDIWVVATWNEYIETLESPGYEKAKSYYHNGRMLIVIAPTGFAHSCDHTIILLLLTCFVLLKTFL